MTALCSVQTRTKPCIGFLRVLWLGQRQAGVRGVQDFREMVQGLVWPVGTGGVIGQTQSLEVFTKPTVQDYLTDFATGGRIPHPFSSDTKACGPAS